MAHNLDITNGRTSFVSAHTDAWHQLGTTLDHSFTAEEAMREGLLGGWNVRTLPLQTVTETGEVLPVAGRSSVVRNNPVVDGQIDVLGTVGDRYTIIQNEEHAGLLNALVDESGAHFETAGALEGGRKVFITMKLPGHINVGGVDPIENYIAAINSHDGSMAFTLMVTPVRIVCANTLNVAFSQKSHVFRIRHTSGAEKTLRTQARQALDMSFNYLDAFQEEAERLINTTMTQAQFEAIIDKEFGAPDDASKQTITRADAKLEELSLLFAEAGTQEGIRNTAWAGFNALTEWSDHFQPTRGEDKDLVRARNAVLYPVAKNRALELMLQA
jgi:phage/plasmid-like protein (TIGR03299 family)